MTEDSLEEKPADGVSEPPLGESPASTKESEPDDSPVFTPSKELDHGVSLDPSPAPVPSEKGDDLPFLPYYMDRGCLPGETVTTLERYIYLMFYEEGVGRSTRSGYFASNAAPTIVTPEGETRIFSGWSRGACGPEYTIWAYDDEQLGSIENLHECTVYACLKVQDYTVADGWTVLEPAIVNAGGTELVLDLWTAGIGDHLSYEEGEVRAYELVLLIFDGKEQIAYTDVVLLYGKEEEDYLRSITKDDR